MFLWNRDLRGGSAGAAILLIDFGGVGLGLTVELFWGLRMLENHFWTADAGDSSSDGGSRMTWELLRLCLADFDRICPLMPSNALCLYLSF